MNFEHEGVSVISFFKKYEYVLAVSKHGGISQAAEALGMAQPTLSKFLKKLEGEIGAELFDRTTVPITLTPAGQLFLESGSKMLYVEKQFKKQLEEMTAGKNAVIRIGISPSRSLYMIPDIVQAYRAKHPSCRVIIEERTTAELNSRLSDGELDLTISLSDADTRDFACVPLFEEDLMLAVPNSFGVSPSASTSEILASVPLINVGKGQAIWQKVNAITDAAGIQRPDIECQSIESGLALVRRGLGCMIVPSYIEKFGSSQNESISFVSFSKEEQESWNVDTKRKVCLFYRKEQFLTESEKDFIDCVKNIFKK